MGFKDVMQKSILHGILNLRPVGGGGIQVGGCNSPAASRHNLASAPIVGFLVEYVYYDHQYEGKVYWTSVSTEQF